LAHKKNPATHFQLMGHDGDTECTEKGRENPNRPSDFKAALECLSSDSLRVLRVSVVNPSSFRSCLTSPFGKALLFMTKPDKSLEELNEEPVLPLHKEFFLFLKENKKWWLIPILLVLALMGVLVALSGSAVAPFIYPLF
jgi:hypothetical protein